MDILTAMEQRHSVRHYTDKKLTGDVLDKLQAEIDLCNRQSGLSMQLITDSPQAFTGIFARYGWIKGMENYIALVGKNTADLNEKCGYYGERIVLLAQQLGLNTCWLGGTYKKSKTVCHIAPGEKLTAIIAIGYGVDGGKPSKTKSPQAVSNIGQNTPDWFEKGVKYALLAPTALHQQKFWLEYTDGRVKATAKTGPYTDMDLGIVKYHFEAVTGKDSSIWL